jgi:hypothetical protein
VGLACPIDLCEFNDSGPFSQKLKRFRGLAIKRPIYENGSPPELAPLETKALEPDTTGPSGTKGRAKAWAVRETVISDTRS